MDRTTAEKVHKILLDVSAELNRSIRIVMENSSEEELHQYRRKIGGLMYELYSEVIEPIHSEYPELTPDEMKWPGDRSTR